MGNKTSQHAQIYGNRVFLDATRAGDLVLVKKCVKRGEDINTKDSDGRTVLMVAALSGRVRMVRYLVEQGADKDAKDNDGETALMWAAWHGRVSAVKYLTEQGADKEAKNNDGNTALIQAAINGQVAAVWCLVEQDANIDAVNNHGNTALALAAQSGHIEVMQCLVEHGAGLSDYVSGRNTSLLTAEKRENLTATEYLINKGVKLNLKRNFGNAALTLAAANGRLDVVRYLIDNGVNIDAKSADGNTALIEAARHGHLKMVKILVEKGADTIYKDPDNNSALILLLRHSDANEDKILRTTLMLLEHGTPPFQVNKQGESARSIAARKNFFHVVEHLDAKLSHQEVIARPRYHAKQEDFTDWLLSYEDVKPAPKAFTTGTIGTLVYMAKYGSIDVVMKKVEITSNDDRRRFQREVRLWKEFAHPNIVKFYGASNRRGSYYMVSEYAENGNLIDYLKKEKEGNRTVVWRKLKEVAYGLKYLHDKRKVIHGDLKGNNIVVSGNGTAMLVDFGMSFFASGSCSVEEKKSHLGAMHWRAPEYAIKGELRPWYDSDVYSLGMCIIQAVKLAEVPWGAVNLSSDHIRHLLCKGERVIAEKPIELTVDQWKLVEAMIAFNRTSRPRLENVIEKLEKFADDEEEASAWQLAQDFKAPGPYVIS